MKRISIFAVAFVFAAIFAVSTFAQAGAQPAASKIGWIDTGMFADEKDGVTKYLNALKALDAELKPRVTELQTIQTKLTTIKNEMDAATRNPAVPVNQQALQAKQDEGLRLQREGEFKKKEFDAAYEKRSGEVLGPITNDILKALQDYAKQKGYAVVLDIAALANQNVNAILALDPTANISKEFITYYNTRPAATASTASPK
ncbi:MAG: OmpH family outer membrane protein [Pyrinomonadaceae bacterium]